MMILRMLLRRLMSLLVDHFGVLMDLAVMMMSGDHHLMMVGQAIQEAIAMREGKRR